MKTFGVCCGLYHYMCLAVSLILIHDIEIVIAKKIENEEKCIWFDECGPDPTPKRGYHTLNCAYNGEPGKIYICYCNLMISIIMR